MRAYQAEVIAMLPDTVDGKKRRWPIAPPAGVSPLAPLMRPYVWQIGLPVTVGTVVQRVLAAERGNYEVSLLSLAFTAVVSLASWSWAGRRLFERHWHRMAIDAYNEWAWRRLRESADVGRMVGEGAAEATRPKVRLPMDRLWREP